VTPRTIERAYAALLYLYPPAFRRDHGREMRQFVRTAAAQQPGAAWLHAKGTIRPPVSP
jgi:hypothetical protein